MNFAERVENLMQSQGKTKIEVANFANITTQTFYDWRKKSSTPSAEVAVKIASYLGTTVEYLITGKESNPFEEKVNMLSSKLSRIEDIIHE